MTRPRASGRTITNWTVLWFRRGGGPDANEWRHCVKRFILAFFFMTAVVGPAVGQSSSLADLIRTGNRRAALERIRAAGTDVNEAQPDGTRPIHWAVYKVDYELIEALIA